MYTIDASVWVSSFDQTEIDHTDSRNFLTLLAKQQVDIYVPSLVLVEVAAAISRSKQDPVQAEIFAKALSQIPDLYLVELDQDLAEKALALAAQQKLRGADAVYAAVAQEKNCVLVTTDNEQLTRLSGIVVAQAPADAHLALSSQIEEDDE